MKMQVIRIRVFGEIMLDKVVFKKVKQSDIAVTDS